MTQKYYVMQLRRKKINVLFSCLLYFFNDFLLVCSVNTVDNSTDIPVISTMVDNSSDFIVDNTTTHKTLSAGNNSGFVYNSDVMYRTFFVIVALSGVIVLYFFTKKAVRYVPFNLYSV